MIIFNWTTNQSKFRIAATRKAPESGELGVRRVKKGDAFSGDRTDHGRGTERLRASAAAPLAIQGVTT
jgi:hypothetical protein